jgi:hypothetical protein
VQIAEEKRLCAIAVHEMRAIKKTWGEDPLVRKHAPGYNKKNYLRYWKIIP